MSISSRLPVICLMGPTASGKTALAVQMVQHLPCEIISVDSAMVYRGMDIGTAKPGAAILQIAPHRLIDVVDPKESYSAGRFRLDALREIDDIFSRGKIPLLVGGTMMYFRILQQGLAALPHADLDLRKQLQARAHQEGWESLHAELASVDPVAAARIHVRDSQRIQRALEVYRLTGQPISVWQSSEQPSLSDHRVINIGLMPENRVLLHERIAIRFHLMLEMGLVDEVKRLYERGDLTADLPSMRSVGYRQVWEFLEGHLCHEAMCTKAIVATRQLAKRQITWLRSWPNIHLLEAEAKNVLERVQYLVK